MPIWKKVVTILGIAAFVVMFLVSRKMNIGESEALRDYGKPTIVRIDKIDLRLRTWDFVHVSGIVDGALE